MVDEMALKLGYTQEEVAKRKHVAMNMDLEEAIKLGLVVNPRIVSCEYSLKEENGELENLTRRLEEVVDDEEERKRLQGKIDELRRKLDSADGIDKIFQENIKPGGKYIVFIPVFDQEEELEDEEGNKLGKKTGADKVAEYEQKIREYLKEAEIVPQFHSMLGSYGNKKNQAELAEFQSDTSEETKFMIVMNKANEGLHIEGLDGMIWARPLDENSKILFLQQLGRVIYSEDPNNPTPENKRPVVIDLANNVARVDLDKDMKQNTNRDDLELLTIVVDWIKEHGGILPQIYSTNKKEQRYAATLYRIQNKYNKYLVGFEKFPDLEEEKIPQIEAILEKGTEIDLWDLQLMPRTKEEIDEILKVDTFEVRGVIKDYVEIINEINEVIKKETVLTEFFKISEILYNNNVDLSKIKKMENGEYKLLKELEIPEIDINKIIEENGLDGDYIYGRRFIQMVGAYNGTGECAITEEQKKLARELKLVENITWSQELLQVASILKANNIDLKLIHPQKRIDGKRYHIRLKDIEYDGVNISQIISNNNLNPDFKYGELVSRVRQIYNETSHLKMTEQEMAEAISLGLVQTKEEKKKEEQEKEIEKIREKEEKIKKQKEREIKKAEKESSKKRLEEEKAKKQKEKKEKEEEKARLKQEREEEKKRKEERLKKQPKKIAKKGSVITEVLKIAQILSDANVDFSKLDITKVVDKKRVYIQLKDVNQNGVNIVDIMNSNNLNPDFKLGEGINTLRLAYNGSRGKLKDEEREEAQNIIGLVRTEEKLIPKTLRIAQILRDNGINLEGLCQMSENVLLKDIKQDGVDIDQIIEKNQLQPDFPFVKNVKRELIGAITGRRTYKISIDEKIQAQQLGLVDLEIIAKSEYNGNKLIGQDIGKAGFGTSVEMCDDAQEDLNNAIEQIKEGGIKKDDE